MEAEEVSPVLSTQLCLYSVCYNPDRALSTQSLTSKQGLVAQKAIFYQEETLNRTKFVLGNPLADVSEPITPRSRRSLYVFLTNFYFFFSLLQVKHWKSGPLSDNGCIIFQMSVPVKTTRCMLITAARGTSWSLKISESDTANCPDFITQQCPGVTADKRL